MEIWQVAELNLAAVGMGGMCSQKIEVVLLMLYIS